MREWEAVIPESDRAVYRKAGYGGATMSVGRKAALLVIDATYYFTGRPGLSLEESQAEFPNSCGPAAWKAIPHIQNALTVFRNKGLPVIFSRDDPDAVAAFVTATKANNPPELMRAGNEYPEPIAPRPGEWIVEKSRASVFFATPLSAYLTTHGVDTLFVCGTSTSGCVRATVVDAFSHGFRVFVIEEGCFDRAELPRLVNLWDMNAKYADVISVTQIEDLLAGTSGDSSAKSS